MKYCCLIVLLNLFVGASALADVYTKGSIGIDVHYYPREGSGAQGNGNGALIAELESSANFSDSLSARLKPYLRLDPEYSDRNSFQLKEAEIEYANGRHYITAGQRILSWSTTESVNVLPIVVADIVNRRDFTADPSGQEKLGRPMVSYSNIQDFYTVQVHLMPYFTPDAYPEIEARETFTAGQFDINDSPIYSDGREETELSGAARVEFLTGNSNIAVFAYRGYTNTYEFLPEDADTLTPVYVLKNMFGFSSQTTTENWLLKSEVSYFDPVDASPITGSREEYVLAIVGGEYTVVRYEAKSDISLFAEYLFDERADDPGASFAQNDLFFGARYSLNDHASTVITGGVLQDLDHSETVIHVNFARRFFESFGTELTLRHYLVDSSDALSVFEDDSLINLNVKYYF